MTVEISYFSLASLAALALFLLIMPALSVVHVGEVMAGAMTGKRVPFDRWLGAIAMAFLVCAGLVISAAAFGGTAQTLIDNQSSVALAFLFFAAPAVLQVLRAWSHRHAKSRALSHLLVILAILSLPASLGVPTAALLQANANAAASASADNPTAVVANERYFTDNEFANDPEDYPIARYLEANFSWRGTIDKQGTMAHPNFYREIPTFTAFWVDQTFDALSFEATDAFGVIVGRITHVRSNYAFSLAIFLYKLLCALVLAVVAFDALLRPLVNGAQGIRARIRG